MKAFKTLLALTVLFAASLAAARLTDNQFQIKVEGEEIRVTTNKGFHLNAEAPASAVFDKLEALYKPETKTEKLFSFKKINNTKTAQLSFYICDDKKTVCEQHKQTVNLQSGVVKSTPIKAVFSQAKDFNLKSSDGRPTLLVFSAPWCPACVRMQTEVYNHPAVAKQISKLNFVKLNSDVAENNELAEKFKLKAIPSLILLDKDGNEAYRWLDYQPPVGFAKSLNQEIKKTAEAAALLQNAQLGDEAAAERLGMISYRALDYAEAFKWLSLTRSPEAQKYKLSAEVSLALDQAVDDKTKEEALQTLQKAIVLTGSELDRLRWTIDYFDQKKKMKQLTAEAAAKGQSLLTEIDELSKNLKKLSAMFAQSTYGDYTGFEKIELQWLRMNTSQIFDLKEEEAKSKKELIRLVGQKKLNTKRPGEMLLAIGYLRAADDVETVSRHLESLIQVYPNTYVYYEKYSRHMQKNKNLERALELSDQALKYPEGNEPNLKLLKASILKDLNRKEECLVLIDEILQTEYIQHKRFDRTRKRLAEIKEELSKKQ